MLDIIFGSVAKSEPVTQLVDCLKGKLQSGTLYIGYPVYKTPDDIVFSDALLVTPDHGVVLFDLRTGRPAGDADEVWLEGLQSRQDQLYSLLANRLTAHPELMNRRTLAIDIKVVTFLPEVPEADYPEDILVADAKKLGRLIKALPPIEERYRRPLNAAIERVTNIKPLNKRPGVKQTNSRGAMLKRIEKEIANLDAWQKKAAIECPDGPQRIRGLAGSGKTIVLALKAVYLHARNPEWDIAVTFYTRSLYQQFKDLIRRFSFDTMNDEPDWDKLHIIHSWGGRNDPGIYSTIAKASGKPALAWGQAQAKFQGHEFEGACGEMLQHVKDTGKGRDLFDVVLIDEAQDFPPSFFQLVWEVTKSPKRVIFAYDELQNLSSTVMAPVDELFGTDRNGNPQVALRNVDGQAKQDIILPICYRNTPWTLATAHALGFGIYRSAGIVQMFNEASLWRDIGYEASNGRLALGSPVRLVRRPDCIPTFFKDLLTSDDAIQFQSFEDEQQQAEWIAEQIHQCLTVEELDPRDILIILPNGWTAKSHYHVIDQALQAYGYKSHHVGVSESKDIVFFDGSIAVTSIRRAKGNEAPMVFVANAQYCFGGTDLSTKRNILFTAMTRSRAWVRVCGVGADMDKLCEEATRVRTEKFELDFKYPTDDEIKKLRRIHRDLAESDHKNLEGMERVLEQLATGDLSKDSLPAKVRKLLKKITTEK